MTAPLSEDRVDGRLARRSVRIGEHAAADGVVDDPIRIRSDVDVGVMLVRADELHAELGDVLRRIVAEVQLDSASDSSLMGAVPAYEGTRLMTVHDVARRLSVGDKTLRRWRSEGRLPKALEVGGVLRWRAEDIDAWIEERVG